MGYYREYRGYEVYLEKDDDGVRDVVWLVRGYGAERATGSAGSRQEAYYSACGAIDELEADPYRYPINLVGYPEQTQGDVVTSDGEVLGHWLMSDNEELDIVGFVPQGADEVLFRDHRIGVLCSKIGNWHERAEKS